MVGVRAAGKSAKLIEKMRDPAGRARQNGKTVGSVRGMIVAFRERALKGHGAGHGACREEREAVPSDALRQRLAERVWESWCVSGAPATRFLTAGVALP
eukprot:ctg_253.g150